VTPFDKAVELSVRRQIAERFPDHGVVGEEFGAMRREGASEPAVSWHLDPIDGTMNFVHGIPWVAVSLAAVDRDGVAVGIVADVYRDEIFSAVRGGGADVDGVPLHCAQTSTLVGGVFLTEWSGQQAWPHMDRYLRRISAASAGTRIMGSCALALTMVGAGRAAGAVLPGRYNSWDVMAGALIARESGAIVYDRNGVHDGVPMGGILAAPRGVAGALWSAWTADEP
jgi:myo-inositol-1(or 4)-monophosphatase